MVPKYETPGFLIGAVSKMIYPIAAIEEVVMINGALRLKRWDNTATRIVAVVAIAYGAMKEVSD
jgi:hypothetical protein